MEAWQAGELELKKLLSALFKQKPPPSLSKIDPICHIAITYVKFYKHVVHQIIKFARTCPAEFRVSLLYIIDAVCKATKSKKGGALYAERFGKEVDAFIHVIKGCPKKDWVSATKILQLWAQNRVLPKEAMIKIGAACQGITGEDIMRSQNQTRPAPIPTPTRIPEKKEEKKTRDNEVDFDNISFNYSDSDEEGEAQFEKLKRVGQEHKETLHEQLNPGNDPRVGVVHTPFAEDDIQRTLLLALNRPSVNAYPSESLNYGAPPPPINQGAYPNAPSRDLTQLVSLLQSNQYSSSVPVDRRSIYSNPPPQPMAPNYYSGPPPLMPAPNAPVPHGMPIHPEYNHNIPHQGYQPPYRAPQGNYPNMGPPQPDFHPQNRAPPPSDPRNPNARHQRDIPPIRREENFNRNEEGRGERDGDAETEYQFPIHVYCTTLYIGKLGRGVSERILREAFSKFGPLLTVISQGSKAFVQFERRPAAEMAKNRMDGQNIAGREISIGWALNPRMAKDSLNRQRGEGHMPANILTPSLIEDLRQRGLIIHNPNDESGGASRGGPNRGNEWNQDSNSFNGNHFPPSGPPGSYRGPNHNNFRPRDHRGGDAGPYNRY